MMKSGKSDSNNKLLNATAEGRKGTDVTVWPGPPLMPIFPRNPEVSVEVSDISAATDKFDYSVLDPEVADEARTIAGRIQGRMRESILETGRDLIAIKA